MNVISGASYTARFKHAGRLLENTKDVMSISELKINVKEPQKASMTLTIFKGDEERDKGAYECNVIDYNKNEASQIKFVEFVQYPNIELQNINNKYTINDEKNVTFSFNFTSHPEAAFKLYNPRKVLIAIDEVSLYAEKYKIVITPNSSFALEILKPSVQHDFGEFKIEAVAGGENASTTLELTVIGNNNLLATLSNL